MQEKKESNRGQKKRSTNGRHKKRRNTEKRMFIREIELGGVSAKQYLDDHATREGQGESEKNWSSTGMFGAREKTIDNT